MPISAPRTTNCPALTRHSRANATTVTGWPPNTWTSHSDATATSATCTPAIGSAVSRAARSSPRGRSGTCIRRAVSCSIGRNTPNPATRANDQNAPKYAYSAADTLRAMMAR